MVQKLTEHLKKKIKNEFIEGYLENGIRIFPSIEALAKRHEIARATIYRHSNPNKEDWQKLKNNYQSQLEKELEDNRLQNMVQESIKLDKTSLNIAQALLSRVGKKIARSIDLERHDPSYEGINATELRELSHVTINAQKIGKLALGEAQEISKVSANVINTDEFNEVIRFLDEYAEHKSSKGNHIYQ